MGRESLPDPELPYPERKTIFTSGSAEQLAEKSGIRFHPEMVFALNEAANAYLLYRLVSTIRHTPAEIRSTLESLHDAGKTLDGVLRRVGGIESAHLVQMHGELNHEPMGNLLQRLQRDAQTLTQISRKALDEPLISISKSDFLKRRERDAEIRKTMSEEKLDEATKLDLKRQLEEPLIPTELPPPVAVAKGKRQASPEYEA